MLTSQKNWHQSTAVGLMIRKSCIVIDHGLWPSKNIFLSIVPTLGLIFQKTNFFLPTLQYNVIASLCNNVVCFMINCIFLAGGLYLTRIVMQQRHLFYDKLHFFGWGLILD